ncbi:transporter HOL1 [Fusarium acutatum]|uniref:Transporter HOL1 n=1 Tax=Fusarium acutatum TaxID=78861 RepID=A0A8H4NJT4_9HYPO|nr:transporter HOL1 [Fusarium acutatum]
MRSDDNSPQPASDFVPGTVLLVDFDGTLDTRHAQGHRDIVLVPTPSDDPDDPLNWSQWRKTLLMATLCVYCLAVGIASAAIYSVLVPISAATGLTVGDLNSGTGYMFLTFGWGCLIWQPLAQKFGKRPVYLLSLLGTTGMMIWAPHATTNGQWIANKLLQGTFGAPIESLCEISVSDVYFAHERGTYIGYYALFLAGSNFVAPVISGFINDGQGWEWVLHWCAIFNGFGFVICLFFMEETKYNRKASPLHLNDAVDTVDINRPTDSPSDGKKELESQTISNVDVVNGSVLPSSKTFLDKLKIFRSEHVQASVPLKGMVMRPFKYFSLPIVVFCGFMYGAVVCYFNVLNGTASIILSAPPYSFKPSIVGLCYIATIIGVFIGSRSFLSGPVGDKLVLYLTRRNNGIREPEYRLWLYAVLGLLVPGGLLLWGVGAAHHVHWSGLLFALGMLGAAITAGCQIPISYCIDCYTELGSDAIVTIIIIRNTMSFAIGYGVTPWVTGMGYQNAFLVAAFVAMAQFSLAFVFIKYGKQLRRSSTASYFKYLEQVKDDGLIH